MKIYKSYLIILLVSMISTSAVFGMENETALSKTKLFFSTWWDGVKSGVSDSINDDQNGIVGVDEWGNRIYLEPEIGTPVVPEVTVQPLLTTTNQSNKSDIIVGVAVLAGLGFLTYKLAKRFVVPYYKKHISNKNIISTGEMNIETYPQVG